MAIVSDVEIRLRADIARLQQDMTAARRSVDTAMGGIGKAVDIAKGALAGLSIVAFVRQVVDAQREFDKLNASLVTATGSTAKAGEAFKALQDFAATTPYSVAEATEAFIKLRNLGLNPSEAALRSYGNTASSQGKSLNQFIEAVADAATGEFERLKEFGIKAKQQGDQVSLTFQGVTKTIGNNSKDIQEYLRRIGDVDFAGAMERRANTLDGVISNLGDSWQQFLLRVSGNGFGQAIASTLLAVSNSLSDLGDILETVGGKADTESGKLKELNGVHIVLTGTFKALATAGVILAAGFREIGQDLGALAAASLAFYTGDFKGVKAIIQARNADVDATRQWARDKIAAIWSAAGGSNDAQTAETAGVVKGSKDRLAQYEVELSAEEKRNNALTALADVRKKLLGVDPQDIADQKKIQTAYDTGAITLKQYTELTGLLAKQVLTNSTAYKLEQKDLDARTAAVERAAQKQTLLNQREMEHIQFLRETNQIDEDTAINRTSDAQIADLNNQIAAQQKLLDIAKKRVDSGPEQKKIAGEIGNLQTKIDNAELDRKDKLDAADYKRGQQAIKNTTALAEAAQQEAKAQEDRTRDMQDDIDALGLTGEALANLTALRLRDRAAALDRQAEISMIDEVTEALHRQADQLRAQADLGITKERLVEQQKFWGDVEQTAHDTFVSIADGGKSAFTRLKDSAKNIFFEWLYQMTLKKWIINIGASADGAGAVAGLSKGASSFLSGDVGTGFLGSLVGGLDGVTGSAAAARMGLSSNIGVSIGNGIASAVGPEIAGAISSGITAAAAAAPWVAGALALYSLGKAAFGRGPKEYADNSTLTGMLGAGGFSGTVDTAYTQKGGWFRSDKHGVDQAAVDAVQASGLSAAYDAIKAASTSYAQVLGLNADSIANRTQAINVALGKDEAANQKAIADFFSGVGDTIAAELLPTIGKFVQQGETASVTLRRLAADFQGVDAILALMATDSQTAFRAVGAASIEARERLVTLAGGLQSLGAQTQYFYDNFLTDAEKIVPVQKQVNAVLDQFGLTSLTTVDQFKQAVQGLVSSGALATEQGAQQYAALLAIAPQFKQVADYLNAVAKAQEEAAAAAAETAEQAQKAAEAAAEAAKQAAEEAEAALVQTLRSAAQTAFDGLQRSVEARKAQAQKAFDSLMAGIQSSIEAATSKVSDLQSLSNVLKSTNLPGTVIDRKTAQAQLAAVVAIARAGGVLPKADDLKDALGVLGQDVGDSFATLQDYQRDQLLTANNVEELSGLTDDQLSTAQATLQVLQDQKVAAQAAYDAQIAELDGILQNAQLQLDAINGLDTSVKDLTQAIFDFAHAASTALDNKTIAAANIGPREQIANLYQQLLGRPADQAGLDFFVNNINTGVGTLAGTADAIRNSAEYKARQAQIVPDTQVQYGTMSGSSAMLSELQTLNTRMANVESATMSSASSNGQLASQFNTASGGGGPLLTTAA